MSGSTQLRCAALAAAAYGALFVSGVVHHFQRTGNLRALARSFAQPAFWVVLLVVALAVYGLWKRQAWAWWLAVAAAAFQFFRIASAWMTSRGWPFVPGPATLVALALLLLILVLVLPRNARLAANR